jgi:NAD(P)-dependent dehydrogenase (short-subunit alcohol dehydrogenase family)
MVKVALVTGAGRGLGYQTSIELAKLGCKVVMVSRCVEHLEKTDLMYPYRLNIDEDQEVQNGYTWVMETFGKLDILINNAAIYWERERLDMTAEGFRQTLNTNLLGAFRITEVFLPKMMDQKYGRIVNVSSGMGRFFKVDHGSLFYSISKLALNAYTVALAKRLASYPDILVNAVCPGWVRTRMGTESAVRSVEEGAKGIVWAATLPENGFSGQFFRDQKPLNWVDG